MKNPLSTSRRPRPIPASPAAKHGQAQRTGSPIARFPASASPAAAIVLVGVAILAASAATMWWATPPQDSAVAASTESHESVARPATGDDAADGDDAAVVAAAAAEPAADQPLSSGGDSATREPEPEPAPPDDAKPAVDATFDSVLAPPSPREEPDAAATPPSPQMVGTVAVAETTEELLALEAIQQREVEADLARPSTETTAAVPPVSKVAAKATTWVNLRAGPSDDAEVLMVVPSLAEIEAETGCNWCAVAYDGREGFIYKNFISYE